MSKRVEIYKGEARIAILSLVENQIQIDGVEEGDEHGVGQLLVSLHFANQDLTPEEFLDSLPRRLKSYYFATFAEN